MEDETDRLRQLENRIGQLEQQLGAQNKTDRIQARQANLLFRHPGWPLGLGLLAIVSGFYGLGPPQHFYQPLFAFLTLLLAYHRGFWVLPADHWRWPLVILNFLLLSLLYKLLISGGVSYPLDWLKTPIITREVLPADSAWYKQLIPDFSLVWKPIPDVSNWGINLGKIQALILLATLAGALFRFQPFASYTAFALILVSIPGLIKFHWDWVMLFLILTGVVFYIQANMQSRSKPENGLTSGKESA